MYVLGIVSSPRREGNGKKIVEAICKGAAAGGAEYEIVHLPSLKIGGCLACDKCKGGHVKWCAQKDDMIPLYDKIERADAIVFSSPVYFGHVNSHAKAFIDRWCVFFDSKFKVRKVMGKKMVTVVTSASDSGTYAEVNVYLHKWFSNFFKMNVVDSIVAGDLDGPDSVTKHEEIMKKAADIGAKL